MSRSVPQNAADGSFLDCIPDYTDRVTRRLEEMLPASSESPQRLHETMRYAVLSGGKRIRPLLVYATGECLGVPADKLDAPAVAIELIHAFSLVHDDLPAMDDDDLRRGRPTVHRQFDEATAILAADALQPLAFEVVAQCDVLTDREARSIIGIIAAACGSMGMTGGQSIDLASEGKKISVDQITEMHSLKTGALIQACVMSVVAMSRGLSDSERAALDRFSCNVGLAFQIRDDILDVQGETAVIGKQVGADQQLAKATWPGLFGLEEAIKRCDELVDSAMREIERFDAAAEPLRQMARLIADRVH